MDGPSVGCLDIINLIGRHSTRIRRTTSRSVPPEVRRTPRCVPVIAERSAFEKPPLLLPAAAERLIELNDCGRLVEPNSREVELGLEELALRVEDAQVVVYPALVAHGREPHAVPQDLHEPRLLAALLADAL